MRVHLSLRVRVCARARACVCVRACARVCVCVCGLCVSLPTMCANVFGVHARVYVRARVCVFPPKRADVKVSPQEQPCNQAEEDGSLHTLLFTPHPKEKHSEVAG